MAIYQIPLTVGAYQTQTLSFNQSRIKITLKYNDIGHCWTMDVHDVTFDKLICEGLSIVCGVPLLWRTTQPYYLWCEDKSGLSLDPMTVADLGTRCELYIGEK